MARTSKFKSPKHAKFEVYTDEISTPHSTEEPFHDEDDGADDNDENRRPLSKEPPEGTSIDELLEQDAEYEDDTLLEDIEASLLSLSANTLGEETDTSADADDERRRESALTTASISSMPESTVFDGGAAKYPFTPSFLRPNILQHSDSLRRMQATPTSFERSPTRRSVFHGRSRPATPRSGRKDGSSQSRRRHGEEQKRDEQDYPLVLLHLTLLPVSLRWSEASMQEILPDNILANLHLLRTKVSKTILQRGILVPHPRGEFELLEERLLEALELKQERVTKCGHFLREPRTSTSSVSSAEDESSVHSAADSGVELSSDLERCKTCASPVKLSSSIATSDGSKWSIKVYAANGLMRSSAWAAAWSEMERVDVEILPYINDELRKRLDARTESDVQDEQQRLKEEEERIKLVVEEQVRIAHESEVIRRTTEDRRHHRESLQRTQQRTPTPVEQTLAQSTDPPAARTFTTDLPRVYQPAEIPLSILLRNYIYLLARDKRNVAIFILTVITTWLTIRAGMTASSRPMPDVELVSRPASSTMAPSDQFEDVAPTLSSMGGKSMPTPSMRLRPEQKNDAPVFASRPAKFRLATSISIGVCLNPTWPGEIFGRREGLSKPEI